MYKYYSTSILFNNFQFLNLKLNCDFKNHTIQMIPDWYCSTILVLTLDETIYFNDFNFEPETKP